MLPAGNRCAAAKAAAVVAAVLLGGNLQSASAAGGWWCWLPSLLLLRGACQVACCCGGFGVDCVVKVLHCSCLRLLQLVKVLHLVIKERSRMPASKVPV